MESNGTQKLYLDSLAVTCINGYKLSNESTNGEIVKTLLCQNAGLFQTPPKCVKKGKINDVCYYKYTYNNTTVQTTKNTFFF